MGAGSRIDPESRLFLLWFYPLAWQTAGLNLTFSPSDARLMSKLNHALLTAPVKHPYVVENRREEDVFSLLLQTLKIFPHCIIIGKRRNNYDIDL